MQKSQYQATLELLIHNFNIFQHRALQFMQKYPHNKSLRDQLLVWVHSKGMGNLIKIITFFHETDLPHPQVAQQQLEWERGQPAFGAVGAGQHSNIMLNRLFEPEGAETYKTLVKLEQKEGDSSVEVEGSSIIPAEINENPSSLNGQGGRSYRRGPYKNYSQVEKMQAVELLENSRMTVTEISRLLGIPCKNIKRWAVEGVDRKRGGGRRKTNPSLEDDIYNWLNRHHKMGDRVSVEEIQEYALSRTPDPTFKASRGWAIKFIDRYNIRALYLVY